MHTNIWRSGYSSYTREPRHAASSGYSRAPPWVAIGAAGADASPMPWIRPEGCPLQGDVLQETAGGHAEPAGRGPLLHRSGASLQGRQNCPAAAVGGPHRGRPTGGGGLSDSKTAKPMRDQGRGGKNSRKQRYLQRAAKGNPVAAVLQPVPTRGWR